MLIAFTAIDTAHWEKTVKKTSIIAITILALILTACASGSGANADTASTTLPSTAGASSETQPTAALEATEPISSSALTTFAFVQEETQARFIVNEVLNNQPKEVIGATNAVEGTLVPDFANPANTTVGAIRIDLSTLQTDSGMRDRSIRDLILGTNNADYQYAVFTPTSLSGLPASITIGQEFTFQITGDLLLHGVTNEETFDVIAIPVSETRIEGLARLTGIHYADYGIAILRLPMQVASVEDTVNLELEFVAEPQ
jgi:polyisoprenoid-binding protein YceI